MSDEENPSASDSKDLRHPRTILVVDDDVTQLRQVQASLSDLAEVRVARRAADVLRLCQQSLPDLLLLDLRLDDGDGLEVVGALQADPALAALPVMLVTAEGDHALRVRAYDLDVVDWLIKPVEEARLRARVQAALARPKRLTPADAWAVPRAEQPQLVLAVDDDPNILDALRSTLASEDIQIRTASTPEEALAFAAKAEPSVVLVDIGLPTLNGFQLTDRLLELPTMVDVPIIFVTQHGDVESEIQALGMGAFDFVSKPFPPEVLRARVRNALRHRRRTQARLDRAEARWQRIGSEQLAAIVAHAQDALITLDEDGRMVLANMAAQRLLAEKGAPCIGLPLPGWLLAGLPSDLVAGRQTRADQVLLLRPGQPPMTVDAHALVHESGGRHLVTLTLKDQTLRLRAEEEARERLRAQAESRTKQLMMSYLAHEIGNPLNGVINLTALMLLPGADPLTPEQARRLRAVKDCADVLSRLMSDALDLARWEAGQFALRLAALPVGEAVAYCIDTLRPAAQAAGVTLAEPSGDLGALVMADGTRLRQSLHNLVNNACKYGRPGGTVRIDVLAGDQQVTVDVMDDGPGIAPENLDRLFEPFDRLGRRGSAGHGLGLAVTRMLVQAMGGRIQVTSTEGVGSRFTLTLPRAPEQQGVPA